MIFVHSHRAKVSLLILLILMTGFFLPSLAFSVQDYGIFEDITTGVLENREGNKDSLSKCDMLRMSYLTEKQTILSRGKYRVTAEDAFVQAKLFLDLSEPLKKLNETWDTCLLQDASIVFRISNEDLSKRMLVWSLYITTETGGVVRLVMDDQTGTVLGFSYRNSRTPFYRSSIPPAESQIYGQELMEWFVDYWGVTLTDTSIISDSGGYMLTVVDNNDFITAELPFILEQDGFQMNISG